ncbi:methyl-accepting chemotaxis protein [Halomonas sp. GFAJ-1]|uniref:methyl-accepting chemotaxis protein n=1 Tax=Halomonas sp. GFAJ-1 TaxID=1118153 RepID=UPI00023A4204|nr:methyl-accepting chemotaxis protein [Halomonas sp. GFAJ-1]AVI61483.1 chemotaxis protein [Halomonas sp. GFAJ-1]EHK60902.1 methyl-accepting chemotaxis sensory transducer [Halomonas sp. GFAJ-1]
MLNHVFRITIKLRLIIMMAVMLLLMLAMGALGFSGMTTANRAVDTIFQENLQDTQRIANLNERARDMLLELSLAGQHDPMLAVSALHDHPVDLHIDNIQHNIQRIDASWHAYSSQHLSPAAQALASQFQEQYGRLQQVVEAALPFYAAGNYDRANEISFTQALPAYRTLSTTLEELILLEEREAQAAYEHALDRAAFMRNLMIGALTAAILLATFLGWLLIQRITQPLAQARRHFHAMANGDLTQPIEHTHRDEVGDMLDELSDMQGKLKALIGNIQSSAGAISTASAQISTGNVDLSQRTEEQASSLQETAASMEQVAATVKNNTQHTGEANQLAHTASRSAGYGGEKVKEAVSKMDELNESSEKISGIVTLIDGIAFQTNILALNASVEAARAGEQGRGFAVVAQEVRNLAQRSADAAKQIQYLILENNQVVEQGSALVTAVGDSMAQIVKNIDSVSGLMEEVSRASDEQTSAIDQMSIAINQMDEVTQQNASLVEQTATASASMEEQAQDLAEAVAFFKVDKAQGTPPRANVQRMQSYALPQTQPSTDRRHTVSDDNQWETF